MTFDGIVLATLLDNLL